MRTKMFEIFNLGICYEYSLRSEINRTRGLINMKLLEIYMHRHYTRKGFRFSRYSVRDLFFILSFAYCLRGRPLYFVVLFPRRYAVVKLDETRYRIERTITASSRVGARLLTRLYVAERLNCTVQRELTPAKTASSSAPGKSSEKITDKATRIARKEYRVFLAWRTIMMPAKDFVTDENCK